MRRLSRLTLAVAASAAAGLGFAGVTAAQQKEVIVGQMCNRTGPTQINGMALCPASHDYYDLINSKGGVEGYQIKSEEIDHEYKVPQAMEAYQRMKGDGATSIMAYGTPQVQALNQKFAEDKIPGTSPGFGIAASADGKRFPYLFPIAATYWSQGAGAIQFVKDKLGGSLEGKKIAISFMIIPPAASRSRSSRISRRARNSSCARLRCRRRGSRWARRCSTSPSATGPIS